MIAVALTGGIGSGKSTVGRLLAVRGAERIDADELARAAIEPGSTGWSQVAARFGSAAVGQDGSIDRSALASVVFEDEAARRDLNAIVHPLVGAMIAERLAQRAGTDVIVVLEIPLFVESGGRDRFPVGAVLVVDSPVEMAVARLVADRRMDEADARRRIAAQAAPGERLRQADYVIVNSGTMEELSLMVERAWRWLEVLRDASAG